MPLLTPKNISFLSAYCTRDKTVKQLHSPRVTKQLTASCKLRLAWRPHQFSIMWSRIPFLHILWSNPKWAASCTTQTMFPWEVAKGCKRKKSHISVGMKVQPSTAVHWCCHITGYLGPRQCVSRLIWLSLGKKRRNFYSPTDMSGNGTEQEALFLQDADLGTSVQTVWNSS